MHHAHGNMEVLPLCFILLQPSTDCSIVKGADSYVLRPHLSFKIRSTIRQNKCCERTLSCLEQHCVELLLILCVREQGPGRVQAAGKTGSGHDQEVGSLLLPKKKASCCCLRRRLPVAAQQTGFFLLLNCLRCRLPVVACQVASHVGIDVLCFNLLDARNILFKRLQEIARSISGQFIGHLAFHSEIFSLRLLTDAPTFMVMSAEERPTS